MTDKKVIDVGEGNNEIHLSRKKMLDERIEGNRTLMEYMGGVYETHPVLGKGYSFSGDDVSNPTWGIGVGFISERGMSFHSNWNWIIKVAAKIKTTINKPIDSEGELYYNNLFNGITDYFNCHLTFLEALTFIQWHNQNSKP